MVILINELKLYPKATTSLAVVAKLKGKGHQPITIGSICIQIEN